MFRRSINRRPKFVPARFFDSPYWSFHMCPTSYYVTRTYSPRRAVLVLILKSMDLTCFIITRLGTEFFAYNQETTAQSLSLIIAFYIQSANLEMRRTSLLKSHEEYKDATDRLPTWRLYRHAPNAREAHNPQHHHRGPYSNPISSWPGNQDLPSTHPARSGYP